MTDQLASITNEGAILMGNIFCCDGHSYSSNNFAFSHMHTDHSEKLTKCLYNGTVYMTKPTRDLLEAINNEYYGSDTTKIKKQQIETLDYGKSKIINDGKHKEKITFYESEHVLGASQVEIITDTGEKIVYSGDITPKDVAPKNIHTLILDSTHGHPQYNKYSDPQSVERRFLDKIDNVIHSGKTQPIVIHAHRGKLQEVMALLSQHADLNEFPFQASAKDIRIANVYKKYGHAIRDDIFDDKLEESELQRDTDWPYIQFVTSFNKKIPEQNGKAHSIFLMDSLGGSQISEDDNSTRFATTSHADYDDVINYIESMEKKPEFIIVDNFRTKQGISLTQRLRSKGFTVECQP